MITACVKMFNGELIQVSHDPRGFDTFSQKIYDTFPDIPLGCIVLQRFIDETGKTEEEKEIDGIMTLSGLFKEEKFTGDDVLDGDFLVAFVDTSLIVPCLFPKRCYSCVKTLSGSVFTTSIFKVRFNIDGDYSDYKDYNEDEDGYMYKKCTQEFEIFYDKKRGLFTEGHTLEEPSPQECAFYHREGLPETHKETVETKWFPTLIQCLESAKNARFPRDQRTFDLINEAFHRGDWRDIF